MLKFDKYLITLKNEILKCCNDISEKVIIRQRKITIPELFYMLCSKIIGKQTYSLLVGKLSINCIMDISTTAIIKKRMNIKSEYFLEMFNSLQKLYLSQPFIIKNAMRKFAIDGTRLSLPASLSEKGYKHTSEDGICESLLTVVYDINNKIPFCLNHTKKLSEKQGFLGIINNFPVNSILIFDRGYFSEELKNILIEKKLKYIFRLRDESKYVTQLGNANCLKFDNDKIIRYDLETIHKERDKQIKERKAKFIESHKYIPKENDEITKKEKNKSVKQNLDIQTENSNIQKEDNKIKKENNKSTKSKLNRKQKKNDKNELNKSKKNIKKKNDKLNNEKKNKKKSKKTPIKSKLNDEIIDVNLKEKCEIKKPETINTVTDSKLNSQKNDGELEENKNKADEIKTPDYYYLLTNLMDESINFIKTSYWQRWDDEVHIKFFKHTLNGASQDTTNEDFILQNIYLNGIISIINEYIKQTYIRCYLNKLPNEYQINNRTCVLFTIDGFLKHIIFNQEDLDWIYIRNIFKKLFTLLVKCKKNRYYARIAKNPASLWYVRSHKKAVT
jgi:hypothetical protein